MNTKYGKIYLSNITNSNKAPIDSIKLFIARQPLSNMDKYKFKHVIELAPSSNLLYDYKRNKITWDTYKERFLKEMVYMKSTLQRVYNFIKSGKDITLICYCKDYRRCHRGIIGEYFRTQGVEIIVIE